MCVEPGTLLNKLKSGKEVQTVSLTEGSNGSQPWLNISDFKARHTIWNDALLKFLARAACCRVEIPNDRDLFDCGTSSPP